MCKLRSSGCPVLPGARGPEPFSSDPNKRFERVGNKAIRSWIVVIIRLRRGEGRGGLDVLARE